MAEEQTILIDCTTCQALVDAKVMGGYDAYDEEAGYYKFLFLKCPKCDNPMLAEQELYGGDEWSEPSRLYPPHVRANPTLPAPIRGMFDEVLACLRAKAYTATVLMCRKVLEGVCRAHGATGGLSSALQELKEKGVIESRLYEWADELRLSGNAAAHDVAVSTPAEDAKDIVDFTNAILEYTFTFRDKFEAFKRRRQETESKRKAGGVSQK